MKQLTELVVFMIAFSLVMPAHIVFARPQGGNVVAGNANIHHSGNNTTINQNSDRAIINWNSFDIGRNEAVRHNMPSASSAALHRVVGGGGPSQIQGLLQSNGNIYLVNPAGVVIHNGARINTNSFTATSRDISNSNFMKGNMVFDRPGRPDAQIINQGNITVKESGLAALVAPTVRNEGVIAGKLAKVALASGDSTWKLDMHGDELITFTVDEKDVDSLYSTDGKQIGVTNNGKIKAEGGIVVMTAAQLDGIVNSVVNTGEVSAASAEVSGGKITFRSAGDITNTGVVDASSSKAKGGEIRMVAENKASSTGTIKATGKTTGGKAVVTGKEVALKGKAKIDVSGDTGGGTALIGGNALGKGPEKNAKTTKVEKDVTLLADAGKKGNGGEVVVWADEKTTFAGSISAKGGSEGGDGGKVETSGKILKIEDGAKVNTSAEQGAYGQWLLDPMDFIIAASGGDMSGTTLSNSLSNTDMTIKSAKGETAGNGDIIVNDEINWNTDTTLTLYAEYSVIINNNITASGDNSSLIVNHKDGDFDIINAKVTLSGQNQKLVINDETYNIIRNIQELQNINNDIEGLYALGCNVDASITEQWNNGEGFYPIGLSNSVNGYFSGKFNGLGNTIYNLNINLDDSSAVGLFGHTSGANISNTHIKNSYISGYTRVGGLVGENNDFSVIKNCSYNGYVDGIVEVGGLVGVNRGTILNSSSEARIYANRHSGGFVGTNSGTIKYSFSNSTIYITIHGTSLGGMIGGFVGENSGASITNNPAIISDCYAIGRIEHVDLPGDAGGFAGRNNSIISNTYSAVSGIQAGFVGQVSEDDEFNNCYWDIDVSGTKNAYGSIWPEDAKLEKTPVGLTTQQMYTQSSFDNWDFNQIWMINEGQGYPVLRASNSSITEPEPTPDPTPDPGTDPEPEPTPDPGTDPNPEPGTEPDHEQDTDSEQEQQNNDEDNISTEDRENNYNMSEEEQKIFNGTHQTLENMVNNEIDDSDEFREILPELYGGVLKGKLLVNVSATLILNITRFLGGDTASLLKIIKELGEAILDPDVFDIIVRMIWTNQCLNEYKYYMEQTKLELANATDYDGIIRALENYKQAKEYMIQATYISQEELKFAEKMADKGLFGQGLVYASEIAKEAAENVLDYLLDFFGVGDKVKDIMTETNDEIAGTISKMFIEHGKSLNDVEQFLTLDLNLPRTSKNYSSQHPEIKEIDNIIDAVKQLN